MRDGDTSSRIRKLEADIGLFQEALNYLHDGFVIYDDEKRLVFCNQAYRDFHGPLGEYMLPGRHLRDMMLQGAQLGVWDLNGMSPEEFTEIARYSRRCGPRSVR